MKVQRYGGFAREHSAMVFSRNLNISPKYSVEICHFIRGKSLSVMRRYLERVVILEQAIPFFRYNQDMSHQASCRGPGRFPVSASKAFLIMFNSLEKNAEVKGLDTSRLVIARALAHHAPPPARSGRHGRAGKRAHVELLVIEREEEKK